MRICLRTKFPANRKINREFAHFRGLAANLTTSLRACALPDRATWAACRRRRGDRMSNRREFITLLGGAAAAWPRAARAEQGGHVRRFGVLMAYAENDREYQSNLAAFREELQKLGWTEGRNVQIDYRWAAADPELMRRF